MSERLSEESITDILDALSISSAEGHDDDDEAGEAIVISIGEVRSALSEIRERRANDLNAAERAELQDALASLTKWGEDEGDRAMISALRKALANGATL